MRINSAIRQSGHRPRSLLVLLNPFGGTRKAKEVWRDIAMPIFDLAGDVQWTLALASCIQKHANEAGGIT